jgi:hypothetical protein
MAFMAFLPEIAAASGEAAAGGAVAAETAGAEAAGAATAEEGAAGRVQNFQQGRQQGQGASKGVTGGEIMSALNSRVQAGAE